MVHSGGIEIAHKRKNNTFSKKKRFSNIGPSTIFQLSSPMNLKKKFYVAEL